MCAQDTRTGFDRRMLRAPRYTRMLDGVTMEMFGGETIAIMYTCGACVCAHAHFMHAAQRTRCALCSASSATPFVHAAMSKGSSQSMALR